MQKSYIMALDAGTTSNRCILFNKEGKIISIAQKEFTQHFPKPGWVEHDPGEIWSTQLGVAVEAMQKAGLSADNIAGIGITNQRETAIVWEKETGEPIYPAIVWQCRRTADICDGLREKGLTETIRKKTGLVIDAYFSATKIRWILDHVPGAQERAEKGELLFGTVETWLIWRLTKGAVHVTDYSNASRTMLFNIQTLEWDEDILKELNIPRCMLPKACPSSQIYGHTDPVFFGGRHSYCWCGRRPAGGALWANLLPRRRSEKYLRYRLFSSDEYRTCTGVFRKRPGYHHCMGHWMERSLMHWRDPFLWPVPQSSGFGMSFI